MEGSASTDSDGTIASYSWEVNGDVYTGVDAIITSTSLNVGDNIVTLTVTDDGGATHTDIMNINVMEVVNNADDICYADPITTGFDMGMMKIMYRNELPLRNQADDEKTLTDVVIITDIEGMGGDFMSDCGSDHNNTDGDDTDGGECTNYNNGIDMPMNSGMTFNGKTTTTTVVDDIESDDESNSVWSKTMFEMGFLEDYLYATYVKNGVLHSGKLKKCDNSCPTVSFKDPSYSVEEDIETIGGEEFVDTYIVLSRAVSYDVNVTYNTIDGDPSIGKPARVNDGDYRRKVNQYVVIPAGQTQVTLPIGIFNDAPIELDEHFFIQLSDPQPEGKVCLDENNRTQINILAQEDAPICFEDNFNNGLDDKWRVLRSRGGFIPHIVTANGDNRLRLTDKNTNLATTITKDYEFETSENLIIVEFDYYAYGGCGNQGGIGTYGADGIVNTLFNSTVGAEPTPGALGGSMGYAQNNSADGFEGGWLGLGIDEYGNFGNCNENREGGLADTSCDNGNGFSAQSYTNTAVIRGDGAGRNGYEFLQGVLLNTISGQTPVAAKRSDGLNDYSSGIYKMTIDARDSAHLWIRLERDQKDGNGYTVIIDQFDAKDSQYNQGITPEKVRYAISSGTGGGCNNHELNWIRLKGNCGIYGDAPTTGPFDAWDTFRNNSAQVPADKNISTKIVAKDFALILASLDETLTGYETKPGAGSNISVAIYKPGTLVPISNTVDFDANTSALITSDMFNLAQAYEEAVVGFKLCATNEVPQGNTGYLYRLWPVANCSGQVNDCTATTTGSPTWHICYSTDTFAVRPDRFDIDTLANPLKAGEDEPINYYALDGQGGNTIGYSQTENGSFEVVTALSPANAACVNQTIEKDSLITFTHGFHDGTATPTHFNTVGDFNLSIQEIAGSEFARVDADDTPSVKDPTRGDIGRLIEPKVIDNIHIVPSGFTLTTTFEDANTANNFTYLHDITGTVKTMAADLKINVQAIIADGSPAENYESSCYADITDLKVDYNYTDITPADTLTILQYNKVDAPTASGTDSIDTNTGLDNNHGDFTIQNFPATLFEDGNAGQADINLDINFDRTRNNPVNPFTLRINDVNLTDDSEVTSTQAVNQTANYFFARANASQDIYQAVGTTINTPILVELYCDLWVGCSALGIDTTGGQTDDNKWWVSRNHSETNGDGNITLQKGSLVGSSWSVDTDVSIETNGEDNTIDVTAGNAPIPTTVDINLNTLTSTSTNEWLIYNKYSGVSDPTPFYQVEFLSTSGWAGVGDTGHVLDINASSTKTKRLNW